MIKDIRNLELTIIKELTDLSHSYMFDNGKIVNYAQSSIAIIKNPFKNGKLDFAVMPYFKDENGNYVPAYSYQEDIQYQAYRKIINECKMHGETIHYAVEDFVKEMAQKKCKACEWADLVINNASEGSDKIVIANFSKQIWRDAVTANTIAKKLMAEAVESLK